MDVRVGFGFDVHQLQQGYDLWLGGIQVPHELGAVGHSDADVLLHVICDALLGATNNRDIGYHFPDTDPAYKGADSKKLLLDVVSLLGEQGWKIGNIDTTICAQRPKLSPHIDSMRACIAQVCDIDENRVSIKATTTEKLGYVGREEGISAYAVVLVQRY
ncbi:MAG: 2-C-methyl-D-erythritol 2,4-cyclodiphosphate synthase [Flavobacteriales bacterium]|nr:2-C-methyl-D-erythritol 2,4-cyclodiphosphate synthase [Flavobacteriales bacterium]